MLAPSLLLSGPTVGVADLLISVSPLGSFPFLMGNTCLQLGGSIVLPVECLQFVPCASWLIQPARVSAETGDGFQTSIFTKQLSSHTGVLSRMCLFSVIWIGCFPHLQVLVPCCLTVPSVYPPTLIISSKKKPGCTVPSTPCSVISAKLTPSGCPKLMWPDTNSCHKNVF